MATQVLVTYGTWCGATQQVAEAIAQTLQNHGLTVDVAPVDKVHDLGPYGAVVIGTGVHAGKVHGGVVRFVKRHHQTLSEIPVAQFVDCLTMKDDTPENRATVDGFLAPMRAAAPAVQPVSVGMFAGAVLTDTPIYRRQFLLMRWMIKAMKDGMEKEGQSDYRNWEAIRAWAKDIAPLLQAA